MTRWKTMLQDKAVSLTFRETKDGKQIAALYIRSKEDATDGRLLAMGVGRRKELALKALDETIMQRCPDHYAYLRAKEEEGASSV